jgi:hypothetical protein
VTYLLLKGIAAIIKAAVLLPYYFIRIFTRRNR